MGDVIMTATEVEARFEALVSEHAPAIQAVIAKDMAVALYEAIAQAAVAAARAEIAETIAAWLEEQMHTRQYPGMRRVFPDVETTEKIIAAIRSGAPQRWAAEREGQGDG